MENAILTMCFCVFSSTTSDILIIVYQMGRLCGGAHEISGIKAQIFLHGWMGGGGLGGGGVGEGG